MNLKSQNSNMLLAFLTLVGVIAVVALAGFLMLRKGPETIQGQAEVNEYRVSSKVPGRILEIRVKEGQKVAAGDTLALLEAPDIQAKYVDEGQIIEFPPVHISKEKYGSSSKYEKLFSKYPQFTKLLMFNVELEVMRVHAAGSIR